MEQKIVWYRHSTIRVLRQKKSSIGEIWSPNDEIRVEGWAWDMDWVWRLCKKSWPKREMEMVRDYWTRTQYHLMETEARRISKGEGDYCWQMKQAKKRWQNEYKLLYLAEKKLHP